MAGFIKWIRSILCMCTCLFNSKVSNDEEETKNETSEAQSSTSDNDITDESDQAVHGSRDVGKSECIEIENSESQSSTSDQDNDVMDDSDQTDHEILEVWKSESVERENSESESSTSDQNNDINDESDSKSPDVGKKVHVEKENSKSQSSMSDDQDNDVIDQMDHENHNVGKNENTKKENPESQSRIGEHGDGDIKNEYHEDFKQANKDEESKSDIGNPEYLLTKDQAADENLVEIVKILNSSDDSSIDTKAEVKQIESILQTNSAHEIFEAYEPETIDSYSKPETEDAFESTSEESVENEAQIEDTNNPFVQKEVLKAMEFILTEVESSIRNVDLVKQVEGSDDYQTVKPDIVVTIGDKEFRTHREILCEHSSYFKDVLGENKNKQSVCHIQSTKVSPNVFPALLSFLYTGVMIVSSHKIRELHCAADFLGIEKAKQKCRELFDLTTDNIKNVLNVYAVACQLKISYAREITLKKMAADFESVIIERDFLDFTPGQIRELFQEETIGARSEIVVFLAALKWINHNYPERERHAVGILGLVNYAAMTMEEALACMHPPLLPEIVQKPGIKTMILNGLVYICAKDTNREDLFYNMRPRKRKLLFRRKPLELWNREVFHPECALERAAVKIQAAFRGYRCRRGMSRSSTAQIRKWYASYTMKKFFEKEIKQELRNRNQSGTTPVETPVRNYRCFLKCKYERQPLVPDFLE